MCHLGLSQDCSALMSLSEILYLQEAEVSKLRQVITEAKVKGGPCERSIDSALDDQGIHRQAYHGTVIHPGALLALF